MGELKCGIYCLYWTNTKHYYIGKSGDIDQRFKSHLSNFRLDRHHNKMLTDIHNKFGEPLIKILEECEYDQLTSVEIKHLEPAINDQYCCNKYANKTPRKTPLRKSIGITVRRDHYKAIRIKFGSIQGFIDAYINAGLPDL